MFARFRIWIMVVFLVLFQFSYAYAFRWTVTVGTADGPVRKIVTDFHNPIYYPLWAFLVAAAFFIIKAIYEEMKLQQKKQAEEVVPEKLNLELKDLKKDFPPGDQMEDGITLSSVLVKYHASDPKFSIPRFLRFATSLFTQTLSMRETIEWNGCSYFVESFIIRKLQKKMQFMLKGKLENTSLISYEITSIESFNVGTDKIDVMFLASFQDDNKGQRPITYLLKELWSFERFKGVKSRGFEKFACPSCGYDEPLGDDGICPNCSKDVGAGRYAWFVTGVDVLDFVPIHNYKITLPELRSGGGRLSIVQQELESQQEIVRARNGNFEWTDFSKAAMAAATMYYEFKDSPDVARLQDFLTPALFAKLEFTSGMYEKANIFVRNTNIQTVACRICRVYADPYYDFVTMRIWFVMNTVISDGSEDAGKLEGAVQIFSDYITFMKEISEPVTAWKIYSVVDEAKY